MEQLSKLEKILEALTKLFVEIEKTRIHYILLFIGFIFIALSISFNRYFFESFFTFIYSLGVIYLQLARKQEFINSMRPGFKLFYYIFLVLLFVLWSLFWIVGIFTCSKYFLFWNWPRCLVLETVKIVDFVLKFSVPDRVTPQVFIVIRRRWRRRIGLIWRFLF